MAHGGMGLVVFFRLVNDPDLFGIWSSVDELPNLSHKPHSELRFSSNLEITVTDCLDGTPQLLILGAREILTPSRRKVRLIRSQFEGLRKNANDIVVFVLPKFSPRYQTYNTLVIKQVVARHIQTILTGRKAR